MDSMPPGEYQTTVARPSPPVASSMRSITSRDVIPSPLGMKYSSSHMPPFITQPATSNSPAEAFSSSSILAKESPVALRCSDVFHSSSHDDSVRLVGNSPPVKQSNAGHAFGSVSQRLGWLQPNNESCSSLNSEFHPAPKTMESSISGEVNYLRTKGIEFDEDEMKSAQKRWKSRVMLIEKSLACWGPSPNMPPCATDSSVIPETEDLKKIAGENGLKLSSKAEKPQCNAQIGNTDRADEKHVFDPDQEAAIRAARAGESFFLTGSAGTGKSFVLKRIINDLRERGLNVVVTASTGCAAVAIQGCTIHSASGVGLGMDSISKLRRRALSREVQRKLVAVDILIIDEISMLDSIIFDKIEAMYKTARGAVSNLPPTFIRRSRRTMSANLPFGGVQVILCGDFFQLPPVAASDPKLQHLKQKFFAFESEAWKRTISKTIVLSRVHRQADKNFVGLLNEIRFGVVSLKTMRVLSACRMAGTEMEVDDKGEYVHYTKLFAYRNQVFSENEKHLDCLKGRAVAYTSKKQIKHDELGMLPLGTVKTMLKSTQGVERLVLKVGARVLCVKNVNQLTGIVNGSAGVVIGFTTPKKIMVQRRLEATEAGTKASEVKVSEVKADPSESEQKEATKQNEEKDKVVTNDGLLQDEVVDLDNERIQELLAKCPIGMDGAAELDCEFSEVMPVVRFDNGITQTMYSVAWDIYGMQGAPVAHLLQIPLTLGWALTIHKAQGMTLDRVETDVGRAFDYGQVYVAMSRAKSMQGLRLTTFNASKVMAHKKVVQFYTDTRSLDRKKCQQQQEVIVLDDQDDGSPLKRNRHLF